MFPTINKKETGVNLRRIMDMRGVKSKDIQEYLGFGCVQSVYRCRHTFCSNMAKSGMNPKMLQYIMGHSDISVTMNTYTHVKFQDAQEDFQKAINS